MKRRILSLILVFLLLPTAFLFSACKDKGYDLNNLQNDFNLIAAENENIKNVNGKFVFDYSNHIRLNSVVEYNYPYTQLKEFNKVFENVMAFSFDYIDECSHNDLVKNVGLKNKVKSQLDDLKKSYAEIDLNVNNFAVDINASYDTDDIFNHICEESYRRLLLSYDDLFEAASNFNNTLADLYFNHILKNGNPNIYKIDSAEFDANLVVNNFDARLKYQISNLSQSFFEMYIDGGKLAEDIVSAEEFFDIDEFDYEDNIKVINKTIDEVVAAQKANSATNKQKYYQLSIQAYNIQDVLNNDNSKYVHACNEISYATIDLTEASAEEKMCYEIIEQRYELLKEYNSVLVSMLSLTI